MKVKYDEEKFSTYYGWAEHYADNIHMHLETDTNKKEEQKIANLILNKAKTPLDRISGVGIDTNHHDVVGLYPILVIHQEIVEGYEYKPLTMHFDEILPFFKGHINEETENYFKGKKPNKSL